MKRALILLLALVCLLLVGCSAYEEGKTFDAEFLKTVSLENMPLPKIEKCALDNKTAGQETLRLKTDIDGFESYINSFVEYMRGRSDIYYFGMQEGEGQIAEMMPHRVATEFNEEFKWESGYYWYRFSYSLSHQLDNGSGCGAHLGYKDPVIVHFEYDTEKSLAYVTITTNAVFSTGCIDEALLDEYNSISYQDNDGALYGKPAQAAKAGSTVFFKVNKVVDADVTVSVNGENITEAPIEYGEYYLYKFTMPNEAVTVLLDIVGGI